MKRRSASPFSGFKVGLIAVGAMLALYVLRPDVLEQLDSKFIDIKFNLRGTRVPSGKVMLVAIDKKSIHDLGKWPWPRTTVAALIDCVAAGHPAVIGLDSLFSQPDRVPEHDLALEAAIRRSGRVVGCCFFLISPAEARYQTQQEYERNLATLANNKVQVTVNLTGEEAEPRVLAAYGLESNVGPIAGALKDCGFYNVTLDPDGSVRRAPLVIKAQGALFYSFAVAVCKLYCGAAAATLTQVGEFVEELTVGREAIRTDPRGRLFLDYYGPDSVFPMHSASDVLAGRVPPDRFTGRIALIGGTSLGEFDMRVSPFLPNLSSIAIQATCIENILDGSYLTESTLALVLTLGAILVFGLVPAAVIPRLRSALSGGLVFLLCLGAFSLLNLSLFSLQKVQASTVYPLLAIVVSYVAVSLHTSFTREREGQRLRSALAEVSETINSILDVEELLPRMLESLVDFVGGERGLLILQEPDAKGVPQLAIKVRRRIGPEEWEGAAFAPARDIVKRVVRSMEGIIVREPRRGGRSRRADGGPGQAPPPVMCVPLKAKNRLVGVIYIERKPGGEEFDPRDLEIIGSFASHWAIAIENARLYSRLREADERLREENIYLKKEIRQEERFKYIIGNSPAMQAVYNLVEKAVDSSITVLIEGETGTGKELVARTIHCMGQRKDRLFVAQNCATLPEPLLESELFGHVKGAFTGATSDKKGLFEVADGGTIFLDEIGEMPAGMQAKLLRVLAEGTIRPVGGLREKTVDVRVISATNRDLAEEVREGRFREDLFYRLNVFPIRMPPLRERKEDIPALAMHFLEKCCGRLTKRIKGFSTEAVDLFSRYKFPGNIRELENEIERAVALSAEGEVITSEMLSEKFKEAQAPAFPGEAEALQVSLREAVAAFERRIIRQALGQCGGNKTMASQKLGLTRQSLQHKIKLYGMDQKS
jgi:Nif-specific regulatory protein